MSDVCAVAEVIRRMSIDAKRFSLLIVVVLIEVKEGHLESLQAYASSGLRLETELDVNGRVFRDVKPAQHAIAAIPPRGPRRSVCARCTQDEVDRFAVLDRKADAAKAKLLCTTVGPSATEVVLHRPPIHARKLQCQLGQFVLCTKRGRR